MPFVRTPPVSSYKVLKTRSSWRAGNILTDSLCHGELNIIQPNTATKSPTTLVARAYREMQTMVAAGSECLLGKVVAMKRLIDVRDPSPNSKPKNSAVLKVIRSRLDVFYLSEIYQMKRGGDGLNHNKLRK